MIVNLGRRTKLNKKIVVGSVMALMGVVGGGYLLHGSMFSTELSEVLPKPKLQVSETIDMTKERIDPKVALREAEEALKETERLLLIADERPEENELVQSEEALKRGKLIAENVRKMDEMTAQLEEVTGEFQALSEGDGSEASKRRGQVLEGDVKTGEQRVLDHKELEEANELERKVAQQRLEIIEEMARSVSSIKNKQL